jgi:hypothetical protein
MAFLSRILMATVRAHKCPVIADSNQSVVHRAQTRMTQGPTRERRPTGVGCQVDTMGVVLGKASAGTMYRWRHQIVIRGAVRFVHNRVSVERRDKVRPRVCHENEKVSCGTKRDGHPRGVYCALEYLTYTLLHCPGGCRVSPCRMSRFQESL